MAFVDADGDQFADISECEGSCTPTLYLYELVYPEDSTNLIEPSGQGWEDITFDSFELGWGSFRPGGASASLVDTLAACSGSAAWEIKDDRGVESSIYHKQNHDCGTYLLLRITFQFVFEGYDPFDTLFVELSLDGGATYHIVGSFSRSIPGVGGYNETGVCYDGKVLLSPAHFNVAGFGAQARLRFRGSANANGDKVYVDNVKFEGYEELSSCIVVDFESGDAGWSNNAASTCTTGEFERGTPNGASTAIGSGDRLKTQVDGDHTEGLDGSGNAFFTEPNTNGPGVEDVDRGVCIGESPVYSMTQDSRVSIWYFHGQRDSKNDPDDDFFKLELSTNGGSTWSEEMAAIDDQRSVAEWKRARVNVPAGSNIRIRVRVSDGPNESDFIEAGVDDLKVRQRIASFLPDLLSFVCANLLMNPYT